MSRRYYLYSAGSIRQKDKTIEFESGENKRSVPITDIDEIYVMNDMKLTTKLLNILSQYGIPIHFFNYHEFYIGSFYPRESKQAGKLLVQQVSAYTDTEKRLYLAQKILQAAAKNIYRNLRYYNGRGKDCTEAMDKICLEAASTFDKEEYRMTSQRIIEHLLEIDANSLHSINQLFQKKRLDLRRDKSFITAILKKRHDIETTNDFIEFIKTQDTEISGFAETIKTAVQSFDEKAHTWQKRQIEDGLVHAVIKLIDTANGDKELKECCLDILDEIYKKRILTDSAVSKLIEGVD